MVSFRVIELYTPGVWFSSSYAILFHYAFPGGVMMGELKES